MNVDRQGRLDLSVVKYVVNSNGPRLRRGDVLFNNTNSPELIGKTTTIETDEELAFSNHMTRLRPPENIYGRFVAHQLHFVWMSGYFKHRCVKHVNQASIASSTLAKSIPLILPPFEEQQHIVAEIEKQFTRLEAGVAGVRRVQANLKRYRAAVLKAACEGKLVPTEAELARQEGRNYETGAQLLDRILTERQQKWSGKGKYIEPVNPDTQNLPSLPEGWVWTTLDQAFVVERGRFSIRPRNDPRYYHGAHPFVQIGDLPRDGGNILTYSQTLNDEGLKVSKKFRAGSILIAIVGATIANTGILTFDSCCPDSLVAIQSSSTVTLRLCEMYLRSIKLLLRSVSYASGGQPNINLATLFPLAMPLPPPKWSAA
jgi:type I restriction enzyme S subunit